MMIAIALAVLMAAGGERDNRAGVRAWKKGDAKTALRHFDAAAGRDTTNLKYRYNRALARSRTGNQAGAEQDWAAAGRDRSLLAKSLYNRGTARLLAAQRGQGKAEDAVADLAGALRLKPGWKQAAHNLELARRSQQQKKNPDGGNRNQPKNQKKPDGGKQPPPPQNQPKDPRDALSGDQADAMLRAAAARDQDRLRRSLPRSQESHGKDW